MSDGYVWAVLESHRPGILGSLLHEEKTIGYVYYPVSHEDCVLTIDATLWRYAQPHTEFSGAAIYYWPDLNQIAEILDKGRSANSWVLLAISDHSTAMTIDPDIVIPLEPTPPLPTYFQEVGYDVADVSGLSALTNIGYTHQDLAQFQSLSVKPTIFGLIEDRVAAENFAQLASRAASEHAPFFPVRIIANKSVDLVARSKCHQS